MKNGTVKNMVEKSRLLPAIPRSDIKGRGREMRKLLALLLVFLLSLFTYNAYTYHRLSSAEESYKLAGIPSVSLW